MEIATTTAIKEQKRRLVLGYIYRHRHASRQDLAQALPISPPTITQNLNDLEDSGLIKRSGFLDSNGGRRAQIYSFDQTARIAIGVEILGSSVALQAYDLYGERLAGRTHMIDYDNGDEYYEAVAGHVNDFIEAIAAKLSVDESSILGVAFAVQGIVSPDGSHLTFGMILGNTGLTLSRLSERIPHPCRLIHDSHASAIAELWLDDAIANATCIYLDEHVGCAVISDGQINEGENLRNGTCEHMTLAIDGPECYCGQRGCMDVYTSRAALLDDSGCDSLAEFFSRAHDGDDDCARRLDRYLTYLAHAIKNARTVLSNDVIIGGRIAYLMSDDDFAALRKKTDAIASFPDDRFAIIRSVCSQGQNILGAALSYIKPFLDEEIDTRARR
ncbi:NagC family transcriptional regulator [Bifidobacterium primatium]|uniref:NagC family transcriptional regulator n=2 Tax=Bifidobacterium TaxID=1678 RepID=A0A2M9HAE0_9BIFI|nr:MULTISPECIES: ROK family transcriptional regulator [Bifidobacterium]NEG96546.1 ROK family protein [Bifidobacterium sp. SMB2]NEH10537.1 ROK family protein [Bifidobacterium saimiriisciurei]NEH10680.1 ROK family protein [Bifidobacterium saimiriisciurei]PJM73780.1 NagC family transcriptional regulator [Bifidobacterium primatium]